MGYTATFGTYWVRTAEGAPKLAKNHTAIIEDAKESSSEEESED